MRKTIITHVIPTTRIGGAEVLVQDHVDILRSFDSNKICVKLVPLSNTEPMPPEGGIASTFCRKFIHGPYGLASQIKVITVLLQSIRHKSIIHLHLSPCVFHFTLWVHVISLVPSRFRPVIFFTEHSSENGRWGNMLGRAISVLFYRGVRQVQCISHGAHNAFIRNTASCRQPTWQSTVVPNGISPQFHRQPLPQEPPSKKTTIRIISIGRLSPAKNYTSAIEAVCRLKCNTSMNTPIEYSIWGDGPEHPTLKTLIRRNDAMDIIKLMGSTSRSNVLAQLDKSHIFLSTSKWEGFGLNIAEAMARGLVLVSPDIPGAREVTESCDCHLVNPNSIASIISGLEQAITQVASERTTSVTLSRMKRTQSKSRKFNAFLFSSRVIKSYITAIQAFK